MPPHNRFDREGELLVFAYPTTFEEAARAAFEHIRIHGANNRAPFVCIFDTIGSLAPDFRRASDRSVLRQQADSSEPTARTSKTRTIQSVWPNT